MALSLTLPRSTRSHAMPARSDSQRHWRSPGSGIDCPRRTPSPHRFVMPTWGLFPALTVREGDCRLSSRRCIVQFRPALSKRDKDMASTLSVGQQMICITCNPRSVSLPFTATLGFQTISLVCRIPFWRSWRREVVIVDRVSRQTTRGSVSSTRAVG
jgi:hypothetical protein